MNQPTFIVGDLFCGAGGGTLGAVQSGVAKVIFCINHDPLCIQSHTANHPDCWHLTEDVRAVQLEKIADFVRTKRAKHPTALFVLHASLECTNYSNAKGGRPRDADSRSLPHEMNRYLTALQPDIFTVENVREFKYWGKLDEAGRPVSRHAGCEYLGWREGICALGYTYQSRMLNSADFGAYTSRSRYFAVFARPGIPVSFPETTHAEYKPGKPLIFGKKPHRSVREVLDFNDTGASIFERARPLVPKTLRRILEGLKKFGTQPLIQTHNTPGYCRPVTMPCDTLTTVCHKSIVVPFLQGYYGNGGTHALNAPAPTLTTKDRFALVSPTCAHFLDRQFSNGTPMTVHAPGPTLTTVPKTSLVSAFLSNPQFGGQSRSISRPAPVLIAAQKSFPLALCTAYRNENRLEAAPDDSPEMAAIKAWCSQNAVSDVRMRMLKVPELKRIQGFPDTYTLCGPLDAQKKQIGNSIVPKVYAALLAELAALNSQCSILN